MATNSILKFADTATSILTDGQYAADPERSGGNQPDTVARSALNNKLGLQTSTMSSGLAQFMADNQITNIDDSLTPAQISSLLSIAIDQNNIGLPFGDNTAYNAEVYEVSAPDYDYTLDEPQVITFTAISNNTLPFSKVSINAGPPNAIVEKAAVMQENAITAGDMVVLVRQTGLITKPSNLRDWKILSSISKAGDQSMPASIDYNILNTTFFNYNSIVRYAGEINVINIPGSTNSYDFTLLLPVGAYSSTSAYNVFLTANFSGTTNYGIICQYNKLTSDTLTVRITSIDSVEFLPATVKLSWETIGKVI